MLNVKQCFKTFIANLFYYFGLTEQFLKCKVKRKVVILAYHRVVPKFTLDPKTQMPGMYVSEESFEMQIKWLKKNFEIVKLYEIIHQIKNGMEWDNPKCVITFDDGWKDNYEYAFPILKRHDIPATVFLVGDDIEKFNPICWYILFEVVVHSKNLPEELTSDFFVDNYIYNSNIFDPVERARKIIHLLRDLPNDKFTRLCNNFVKYFYEHLNIDEFRKKYEILSRSNIQEMSQYGIDFGYHSQNHFMLTNIAPEKLNNELIIPKYLWKDNKINFKPIFCYPDGRYNNEIINLLKINHYIGAVTLSNGVNDINTEVFKMNRINIHEGIAKTLPLFLINISKSIL